MKKETKQNIILLLGTLFVLFIIAEIITRILLPPAIVVNHEDTIYQKSDNPILVYEFKPNLAQENSHGVFLETNPQGFRDDDFSQINADAIKIAVLGDSVSANLALEKDAIYVEVLDKLLNQNSSVQYEVLNFGVNGYGIEQEVEILKNEVLQFEPDAVIFAYVLNDPTLSTSPKNFFLEESKCYFEALNIEIPCGSTLKNIAKTSRFVTFLYTGTNNLFQNVQYTEENDFWTQLHETNYQTVLDSLDEIQAIQQEQEFSVFFVIFPLLKYSQDSYHWQPIHEKVAKDAQERDFIVIDLLPAFLPFEDTSLRNTQTDYLHSNKQGNEIAAHAIYAGLEEMFIKQ